MIQGSPDGRDRQEQEDNNNTPRDPRPTPTPFPTADPTPTIFPISGKTTDEILAKLAEDKKGIKKLKEVEALNRFAKSLAGDSGQGIGDSGVPSVNPKPSFPPQEENLNMGRSQEGSITDARQRSPECLEDLPSANPALYSDLLTTDPTPRSTGGELSPLKRLSIGGRFSLREDTTSISPDRDSAEQPEADPKEEIRKLEAELWDLSILLIETQQWIDKIAEVMMNSDSKMDGKKDPRVDEALTFLPKFIQERVRITNIIVRKHAEIERLREILAYQNSPFGSARAALRRFSDRFIHRKNVRS